MVGWTKSQNFRNGLTAFLALVLLSACGGEQTQEQEDLCLVADSDIWTDCLNSEFGPFESYESNAEQGEIFHTEGQGDYHVQWQQIDLSGDRQKALSVTWNANDPEHISNTNGWFGIGANASATEGSQDLSAFAQGSIEFDIRLAYAENAQNPTPFIFKMECGWPCSSAEMSIVGLVSNNDWQTHRYSIAELINSGLDISQVTYPFIIQPLWRQQEQELRVEIDNIRLLPTYTPPEPEEGCPKAGRVSYSLARSDQPSVDEQDAYNRITAAMDEAVRQYNCYTNLQRDLRVSYNPGVATADGSTNGSIRFGSRASMHHVTAMHEIAHVFGVGAGPFRSLVQDGIYYGEGATAELRAISGANSDRIMSDGTHFWPHGLNYISEGQTQEDLINHCRVVEAMVGDLNGL